MKINRYMVNEEIYIENEEAYIEINNPSLCIICLEILDDSAIDICSNCDIKCHKKCLSEWYKSKKRKICPICLKTDKFYKRQTNIRNINEENNEENNNEENNEEENNEEEEEEEEDEEIINNMYRGDNRLLFYNNYLRRNLIINMAGNLLSPKACCIYFVLFTYLLYLYDIR